MYYITIRCVTKYANIQQYRYYKTNETFVLSRFNVEHFGKDYANIDRALILRILNSDDVLT